MILIILKLIAIFNVAFALENKAPSMPVNNLPPPLLPTPSPSSIDKKQESLAFTDEMLKARDPFKMPDMGVETTLVAPILERFPVETYKMSGILMGADRMRAMVVAPDGKSYMVSVGAKIGNRGGSIEKITNDSIKIREKFINVLGQEEVISNELTLPSENRPQNDDGSTSQSRGLPTAR